MARSRRPNIASPVNYSENISYNIKLDNTSNFRAAMRSSTTNVGVAFMGDSTIRGVDEGANPYNAQYSRYAMPIKVADYLNNAGISATAGYDHQADLVAKAIIKMTL